MKAVVSYQEIKDFVRNKWKKEIGISPISSNSVCLSYKYIKNNSIEITVKKIENDDILLLYNGSWGVGTVVKIAIKFLNKDSGIIEQLDNNQILVHLAKINKIQNALQNIKLNSITFGNETVELGVNLR